MADKATMTTVKVNFDGDSTLEQVAERVRAAIGTGRGSDKTTSEKEMVAVTALPGFALRALMALQRWADAWNLLPGSVLRGDPLYASVFVANLGSVGLEAPFHHLFEMATRRSSSPSGGFTRCPVLDDDTLGVGTVIECNSLDERIADGCARSPGASSATSPTRRSRRAPWSVASARG